MATLEPGTQAQHGYEDMHYGQANIYDDADDDDDGEDDDVDDSDEFDHDDNDYGVVWQREGQAPRPGHVSVYKNQQDDASNDKQRYSNSSTFA
jgi:hypothetical protein